MVAEVALGLLIGGLLVVLYLVYRFVCAPFQVLRNCGIKGPTPTLFIGNYSELIKTNQLNRGKVFMEKYGPVTGYYLGKRAHVMISDLDILKQIMVKDFDNFADHIPIPNIFMEGTDLFSSKGEKWKATRRTLTPSFSASKLKMMLPLLKKSTDTLVEVVEDKVASEKGFDVIKLYSSFTMETILATAFGRRVDIQRGGSDEISENIKLLTQDAKDGEIENFFTLISNFPFLLHWLKHGYLRSKAGKAGIYLKKVALDLVKARRESGHTGKYKDILQLMIEASGEEESELEEEKEAEPPAECPAHKVASKSKGVMTDAEIVANAFGFLFAGNETTSSSLSFVSYLLALHPDIQEKLQSEIDAYFNDKPEASLYTAAQEMSYLDNVLQETLRLYPPALETNRYCNKTTVINGVTIPKGVAVVVPIYTLHHSELYWEDPEKFDPDRFTAEERAKRPQLCHMPFGFGPRSCIGMRLALLEAKIALIELLRRFTFVKAPETEVPLQLRSVGLGIIKAKNGITLKVINRVINP